MNELLQHYINNIINKAILCIFYKIILIKIINIMNYVLNKLVARYLSILASGNDVLCNRNSDFNNFARLLVYTSC